MHSAALLLALIASLPSQNGEVTIPHTDRPPNFSGAAGAYVIEVRAEPTTVQVEDPITLTVKIISRERGPWLHPPLRDNLRLFAEDIDADFFVEPLPERDRVLEGEGEGEHAWEFSWRLMPKHGRVQSIPALEFVYYHTVGTPGFKAADGARSIALNVQPRAALVVIASPQARAKFQRIVQGPALLAAGPAGSASLATVIGGLVLPPTLCLGGYVLWRQLFPDAAKRLRRRRSRALRVAQGHLRKLGASATPAQVRAIVADYLRLHLDLPQGGPTPAEVRGALQMRGLNGAVATETDAFVQRCDAALFAPAADIRTVDLQKAAAQLLQHLEAELCACSSR